MRLDPSEPAFTIGVAAKLTQLSQKQLRLLESREIVVPGRTSRGRRLYSLHQLDQLRYVAYLMSKRKVNPAGVLVALELLTLLPEEGRLTVLSAADDALAAGLSDGDLEPLLEEAEAEDAQEP